MVFEELFKSYLMILFSENISETDKEIFARDAYLVAERILSNYKKLNDQIREKFLILKNIAELFQKHIISVASVEKIFNGNVLWSNFKEEILNIISQKISEGDLNLIKEFLIKEKQYIIFEQYIQEFKDFIIKYENRDFKTITEIISSLKSLLEKTHLDILKEWEIEQQLDGLRVIDFNDSSFLYKKMYDYLNSSVYISTGLKNLDRLLGGGFEKTRLYLFAGKPGSGKSTFLLNFLYNIGSNIIRQTYYGKESFLLYVTLENLAIETNQRLLCRHLQVDKKTVEEMIKEENNELILNAFDFFKNSNIVITYFSPKTLTISDLINYIEDLSLRRNQKIMALFVDYLDLMKAELMSNEKKDMRFQLGEITAGLKTIATMYKIPVITATQLVKSAYENSPQLDNIKESSEKIEYADVIGVIKRIDKGDNFQEVIEEQGHNSEIYFLKNRSNNIGTLKFLALYDKYYIEEGKYVKKNEEEKKKKKEADKNDFENLDLFQF